MRKMQQLVWSASLLAAAWCGSAWGAELTLSPWTPGRPGISEQALLFDVEGGNSGSSAPSFLHTLPDQKELDEGPNRKTLFTGPLNDRSAYGKAWFPEPLSNAEMDLEYREAQIKYNHSESTDRQFDEIKGEFEQAFGALTIEIELPWQNETVHGFDPNTNTPETEHNEGFSRVEIGARYPWMQWVSADGSIDYTLVGAFEVAIPTYNDFSKDFEVSPRGYSLLRLGDHFSIQGNLGAEFLIGPDRGGSVNLIYGVTFGYNINSDEFKIPWVTAFIPMFEITGEHLLTGVKEGDFNSNVMGTLGFRFNMESFGPIQPRIGIGYTFPMNKGANADMDWGVVFSCIFEM